MRRAKPGNQELQISCPHLTAQSSMTSISGSIQLILSFIRHILIKRVLFNSPITDQSMANKHWTFLTPATPSIIYPYFPYILPFQSYFSCPEQENITTFSFLPNSSGSFTCLFYQISSKYNSKVFSSPESSPEFFSFLLQKPLETSFSLLSFHPPLLLDVSSLTRVQ